MIPAFLEKLLVILNDKNPCISWCFDGSGIVVSDKAQFVETVLPQVYHHSSFSAFKRQLNVHGFRKASRNANEHIYLHPNFKRCQTHLAEKIHRQPRVRKRNTFATTKCQEEVRLPSLASLLCQEEKHTINKMKMAYLI